jgi:hypothetical protein
VLSHPVFAAISDGLSSCKSAKLEFFFERRIADIEDEILLQAVLQIIEKFFAIPRDSSVSAYEKLILASEPYFPADFAESLVNSITRFQGDGLRAISRIAAKWTSQFENFV